MMVMRATLPLSHLKTISGYLASRVRYATVARYVSRVLYSRSIVNRNLEYVKFSTIASKMIRVS